MSWFRRGARKASRETPAASPRAPGPADAVLVEAAAQWWRERHAGAHVRADAAAAQLYVHIDGPSAPASLVVTARRGKLVRVEVFDRAWRGDVDAMVGHFEARGVWSFNGVVRTVRSGTDPSPSDGA